MYQLNEVSEREKEGIVDEENKQDSDVSSHVMRDLAYFVFCTYGLYCYSRTLVTRFITYEKSQLQQAYLTNLFDQQKDGLVVTLHFLLTQSMATLGPRHLACMWHQLP